MVLQSRFEKKRVGQLEVMNILSLIWLIWWEGKTPPPLYSPHTQLNNTFPKYTKKRQSLHWEEHDQWCHTPLISSHPSPYNKSHPSIYCTQRVGQYSRALTHTHMYTHTQFKTPEIAFKLCKYESLRFPKRLTRAHLKSSINFCAQIENSNELLHIAIFRCNS